MNIKLIELTVDDTQSLLEMQKVCFSFHLQRYEDYRTNPAVISLERIKWQIENENFYKIMYDNLWVGAINIRRLNILGQYKLHIVYILPGYQGRGIGQEVIRLAEGLFEDATSWCLETLEDMPSNRHVYEKLGYKFTGKTEKINDKLTLVYYKKEIT